MRFSARAFGASAFLAIACSRSGAHTEAQPAAPSATAPAACNAPSDVSAPPGDALRTASGVASKILKPGQGSVRPDLNDCARLRYTSWKRDGSLHAATPPSEPPLTQCLRRAMPGVAEALQQMVAGEERRVWVPAELTYSAHGDDPPAPKEALTFDLTLLEVLKAPEMPADLNTPPASALRTPSGLALEVLSPGIGKRHALPADRMRVRFTGWTSRGELFETTELAGQPASVTRADVVPGVGEGLSLMQIGEKARVWLPAALAFGDKPRRGSPTGNLTYDLELLAVE